MLSDTTIWRAMRAALDARGYRMPRIAALSVKIAFLEDCAIFDK